jgi:predicted permease
MNDLRFALRQLVKSPGFSLVAVLSLGLGIGVSTGVFSLVNGILLSSLPVPNPHELRVLQWSGTRHNFTRYSGSLDRGGPRATGDSFSFPLYQALRERCSAQAEFFGYQTLNNVTAQGPHESFTIDEGLLVTDNFFSGLGARAWLGRTIGSDDTKMGAPLVTVLSYACWQRQFDLDPTVVGRTLMLNGTAFTIVGVMPQEFHGHHPGAAIECYVPIVEPRPIFGGSSLTAPEQAWLKVEARLKPGVTDAQFRVAAEVAFAAAAGQRINDAKLIITSGHAGPGWQQRYYRETLLLLLGVVAMVVIVACANLAGLLLARGAARQHEFAIRAAIGASRWRLARQPLVESLVLAGAGMIVGLIVASWTKSLIGQLLAGSADGLHYDTSLDLGVLGFAIAVALVTAVLSGLLPASSASHTDPNFGLKSAAGVNPPRLRLARGLVVAQIALSIVLLTGATLYVRTLVNLVHIHPGFAMENLLLFRVNPRAAGQRGPQLASYYERAQQALAAIPGVRSVALTQNALLGNSMSASGFELPGQPATKAGREFDVGQLNVSETFFDTMSIPIVLGRGLAANDIEGAAKAVVVNQAFVRTYLPDGKPLGQLMKLGSDTWEIVGVCGDALYTDLKNTPRPTAYFSFRQSATGSAYFALRTSLPPLTVVTAARKALAAVDPTIPLANITTQERLRDQNITNERLFAALCGALGLLAVLLACIGLNGLIAYQVARRTREIGLRMALGARPREIAARILRDALRLALMGVAVGVPAALGTTQIIRHQLYGVSAYDPATLGFAALALITVAALAAWLPARRAAAVDPMTALRAE